MLDSTEVRLMPLNKALMFVAIGGPPLIGSNHHLFGIVKSDATVNATIRQSCLIARPHKPIKR